MFTKFFTTAIMLAVLTLTVLKLPRWIGGPLMRIPSWLQALIIHFGYGGWIGGVTGHLLGGLLAIPWFFISEYFLRPRLLGITASPLSKLFAAKVKEKAA